MKAMTMTDINAARILARQGNIARYRRILATKLTELERSFVLKRLAEEKLCLSDLQGLAASTDSCKNSNDRAAA